MFRWKCRFVCVGSWVDLKSVQISNIRRWECFARPLLLFRRSHQQPKIQKWCVYLKELSNMLSQPAIVVAAYLFKLRRRFSRFCTARLAALLLTTRVPPFGFRRALNLSSKGMQQSQEEPGVCDIVSWEYPVRNITLFCPSLLSKKYHSEGR